MSRRLAVFALCLAVCSVGPSSVGFAVAATDSEFQSWTSVGIQAKPQSNAGVAYWLDLQLRRTSKDVFGIVRPGIGYQFTPNVSVVVGYAWTPSFPDEGPSKYEQVLWQQLLWSVPSGKATFGLRPRLEQRSSSQSEFSDFGHRARLWARAAYTLVEGKPVMLVGWDELFWGLNTTNWGAKSGFDQNRVFAGLGLATPYGLRLEVGYLNIFANRKPNNQDNHALSVGIFYVF
jgi:hypothetical protein